MKQCPQCQRSYDDDSYEFCLEDGTVLVKVSDAETLTDASDETETIIRNTRIEPTSPDFLNPQYQNSVPPQVLPLEPPIQSAPPKSNTAQIVLLTIGGMFALLGIGFGAWYFLGDRQTEIVQEKNNNQTSTRSPSPKPTAEKNVNVAKPTISPTPESTPTPEFDSEEVKSEVSGVIDDWKSATEAGDINACMSNYADTVDFYNKRVSRSFVRNNKQDSFDKYDSMSINLSNLRVSADASGEKATAVFDKEWNFSGEKAYEGKVQSQFQLVKSGGRWLITSEKDLKIYYVRK